MISPNKHILVKNGLEKIDLGEIYIQKEQENFKKRSSSNTIGGPIHMSHPVKQKLTITFPIHGNASASRTSKLILGTGSGWTRLHFVSIISAIVITIANPNIWNTVVIFTHKMVDGAFFFWAV